MDIVLDTNIFIESKYLLQSKEFEILEDYLKKTNSFFILPEVILLEVEQKYKEELIECLEQQKKSTHNLNLLQHSVKKRIKNVEIDIEKQTKSYIKYLRNKLNILQPQILPYKNEYLPELLNRAITKTKPFQKEDKGFRDTIIWLTLKDYCKSIDSNQLIFISTNRNDFGTPTENSQLNQSLLQECNESNIKINYFNSVNDFVEKHSTKIDFITSEWIDEKLDETVVVDLLWDKLENESMYSRKVWAERFHDFDRFDDIEITSLNPYEKDDIHVYEMIDGTLVVNVTIIVEVEFNLIVHVFGDGYYDVPGQKERNYSDCYGYFSLTVQDEEIVDISLNYWE